MALAGDDNFQQALLALGRELNLDLAPDDNGVLTISFADGSTCSLEHPQTSDSFYFHAPLMRAPRADRASVLEAALRLNVFSLAVRTAWIGLDPQTDELLLCGEAPVSDIRADGLSALLASIASALPALRASLTQSGVVAAPAPIEASREAFEFMIRI